MKPKYIKPGSILHFVAPSFGCTTFPYEDRLLKSMRKLEALGYKIKLGENCFKAEGVVASASASDRGKEFMNAYRSDCDAIISVGGGELMVEMLDYVNFEEIKALPPKWFMGFSDNTNLTYTLTTLCDIETVYGVCATRFYTNPLQVDARDSLKMLEGEKNFIGYPMFELVENKDDQPFNLINFDTNKIITPYKYNGDFSGVLLGGCLDTLVNLCGTKYDNTKVYCKKKEEGIIFYLEACDLNPVSYRRALIQLKNAGWFDNVNGFVLGRALDYGNEFMGVTFESAAIDILGSLNVPILINADLGHLKPALPFRNGAFATISYENSNIIVRYK